MNQLYNYWEHISNLISAQDQNMRVVMYLAYGHHTTYHQHNLSNRDGSRSASHKYWTSLDSLNSFYIAGYVLHSQLTPYITNNVFSTELSMNGTSCHHLVMMNYNIYKYNFTQFIIGCISALCCLSNIANTITIT